MMEQEHTRKEEAKEPTKAQLIKAKIKELKKLETIDKQINSLKSKIAKLESDKVELEKKYNL